MTSPRPLPRLDGAELSALRDGLLAADYTVPCVAERTGSDNIYEAWSRRVAIGGTALVNDSVDALIRLYLEGRPLAASTGRALLGERLRRQLEACGLLQVDGDQYRPTTLLYPTEALYLASDLPGFDGAPLPVDAVYPAITPNTRAFVAGLPTTPCDRFLELCAGTGIAALLAAPRASHAWAADLTDRATHFARFNAQLNGLPNVTAVAGDLYQPVAGATFDRIAAHPPYVPSSDNAVIYRDGGADGEFITRGVIAGLPSHLAPGGVCYCTCVATDRTDAPLETRLRQWIGPVADAFDVVLAVMRTSVPSERVSEYVSEGIIDSAEAERRIAPLEALGIERQVYVSMAIRRHAGGRPPATVRRALGKRVTPAMLHRLVYWESAMADPDQLLTLMGMRFRVAPDTGRHTVESWADGQWRPASRQLARERPFTVRADYDPAVATLLGHMDGARTVHEHWEAMTRDGAVPGDLDAWRFASVVRSLASSGIIVNT